MIMNKFSFNKFWVGCITSAAIIALTEGQYVPGTFLVALIFWQAGVEKWAENQAATRNKAEVLPSVPVPIAKNKPFKAVV